MGGSVDLSFESFEDIGNIPSTNGMGWLASELKQENWTVALNSSAIREIASMVVQTRRNPLPTLLLKPEQFEIPELKSAYEKAKAICDHGAGFAVIDKLPIDDFEIEDMVNVYWTLGHFMGLNVAQKWDGTMIYNVTNTGKKYGYGVRGSATNVELVFHTDNAFGISVPDYVGLMCKYPAKKGGLSRFCSLYTVHSRMEEKYPDELRRLYRPVYFDRQAEHAIGEAKTSYAPMFSWKTGKLRCRANSSLVRKGYQVGEIEMDTVLKNALEAIDEVTSSADLWIEAPLSRGEVQYLNNHELGHYRSNFIDHDAETKKRHLYRLWHRADGNQTYDG
tara:strand:+ start:865 stop:1866 length:1002 start_codon:yes stop_codon:yes gene_type:complete